MRLLQLLKKNRKKKMKPRNHLFLSSLTATIVLKLDSTLRINMGEISSNGNVVLLRHITTDINTKTEALKA